MAKVSLVSAVCYLFVVLGISIEVQAITIRDFDELEDKKQKEVIGKTYDYLMSALASNKKMPDSMRKSLTSCMLRDIEKVPVGSKAKAPPLMTSFALTMAQQRAKKTDSTVHVEHVLQAVFNNWLAKICVKEYQEKGTQTAR
tara:strand:+ start:98 stop:523 length:426 start_codon:yes stop_codon:yes gene_type:complete